MSLLIFHTSAGAPAEILGAAGLAESADTVTTPGAVALLAACGLTSASDTLSAAGGVALRGDAAITHGEDSLAASALLALVAEAACLESDDAVATVGGSYTHASVSKPSERQRRRPMRWVDEDGNEVDLVMDEGGSRHLLVRPTGKKPYKPVRGIRVPRPVGVA